MWSYHWGVGCRFKDTDLTSMLVEFNERHATGLVKEERAGKGQTLVDI
jgi:hypothetical protein